ncbi:MAG: hypothetical protein Q8L45_05900 [Xanthomonadaceae bacterium]|nr:hypothetical protein [Xanthomonadaceae bacterium]MDP2185140.1 hypothetical protein [Xanthomonadales bacterium]MDZ4115549.1 hypothetical protein [Xanthomonadaceae bacterium]MDZ4378008.1 hypothetical protein [Xanthomonadaceae bacterium]
MQKHYTGAMRHSESVNAQWVQRRVQWHRDLHDPSLQPFNTSPWLPELRRWQSQRLAASFSDLLADERMRPAATFFLTDLYADRDFTRRDQNIAKVVPLMARMLPASLLRALGDAVALGALSHALDLRMVRALSATAVRELDARRYADAYHRAGCPRLRCYQIDLIVAVGQTLDRAVHKRGVSGLLRASRVPARLAGVGDLQQFLERGFSAFAALDGASDFLHTIAAREREVSRRLFAGHGKPFARP